MGYTKELSRADAWIGVNTIFVFHYLTIAYRSVGVCVPVTRSADDCSYLIEVGDAERFVGRTEILHQRECGKRRIVRAHLIEAGLYLSKSCSSELARSYIY